MHDPSADARSEAGAHREAVARHEAVAECERLLAAIAAMSVRFPPPGQRIAQAQTLRELVAQFRRLDRPHAAAVRAGIDARLGGKLIALGTRAGERAIDCGDAGWLADAVFAHAIEGMKSDYRENYRSLSLLRYAAGRIGASLAELLRPARGVLEADAFERLAIGCHGIATREHLWSDGIEVRESADGVRFLARRDPPRRRVRGESR